MRSLLAVSEHGGVTGAARAIGVSQSALSRRLAQLEEGLGVPLLERSGRGVAFTALGQIVLTEGAELVQRFDRLKSRLDEHLKLGAGVVRVGGGATAVAFVLPSAIAAFRKRYPRIVFQVREAGSLDVEAAVVSDELELGIVTLPIRGREVDASPLRRDRIVLVAAKDHPLSRRRRVPASALNGQNLVGFEAGTAVRRLIDAALEQAGVEVNVVMELRSVAAILQMVETTGSLAFVSELAVAAGSVRKRRSVVPVRLQGLQIERELSLIKKQGRSLSPAAREFASMLC